MSIQKRVIVLGSSGSVGQQTLEVAAMFPEKIRIVGLSVKSDTRKLYEQINLFRPEAVCLEDRTALISLMGLMGNHIKIYNSTVDGLVDLVRNTEADIVVIAVSGLAGLKPTIAALETGKHVALANKETLVAAGDLIMALAKKHGVHVLPADSEHSAIFQCLIGAPRFLNDYNPLDVLSLTLTASGGAFRDWSIEDIQKASVQDALKHPNWSMGKKITVDSATIMNKGLEVIEAHWLFGVPYDNIKAVIHKESIVHSAVELIDGSMIAQMSQPDMRGPLLFCLSYPERWKVDFKLMRRLNLEELSHLSFCEIDLNKYPCFSLALEAGRMGGTAPAIVSAANEVAVEMFIHGEISFIQIYNVIKETLEKAKSLHFIHFNPNINQIFESDAWARRMAIAMIDSKSA